MRAALCISPENLLAMYGYAMACRGLYLAEQEKNADDALSAEYIGRFKAESLELFERITVIHPKHSRAHYYLGYGYLNMGLYLKAKLAFEEFVRLTAHPGAREEVRSRILQIMEPVRIEEGCNAVLSGRYELGIEILEPYLKTQYKDWWPLSYYLGLSREKTGEPEKAEACYKRVLQLYPSHVETMQALENLYAEAGEPEKAEKYRKKAELVSGSACDR